VTTVAVRVEMVKVVLPSVIVGAAEAVAGRPVAVMRISIGVPAVLKSVAIEVMTGAAAFAESGAMVDIAANNNAEALKNRLLNFMKSFSRPPRLQNSDGADHSVETKQISHDVPLSTSVANNDPCTREKIRARNCDRVTENARL
jgi:hypothetical protein